jgi:hypothetical protein
MLPQPQLRDLPLFNAGAEIEAAYLAWKCNCGPTAIAAATGKPLDQVRAALTKGTGRFRGYTTVPDVQAALRWLDVRVVRTWPKPPKSLLESDLTAGPAIMMIQFGGPWMRDPRAAAKYRHLIAFRYGWLGPTMGPRWVGDVNTPAIWCLLDAWRDTVVDLLAPDGGDGTWSIGWACQLAEAR